MSSLFSEHEENLVNCPLKVTLLLCALLLTIFILHKLLGLAHIGFDLTDEGYYFTWITNPWIYKYYISQFGYIYHPLYKILNLNIGQLRQANILISYSLSLLLCYYSLKQALSSVLQPGLLFASAFVSVSALFILTITGAWVPSPSYNSLNFQACLIFTLGLVFSFKDQNSYYRIVAMSLIGLGGWLSFMAKPTTALFLSASAVFILSKNFRANWRILVGAAMIALLLLVLSALYIDGSLIQFMRRLQGGVVLLNAMDGGHGLKNLLRLDVFQMSALFKLKVVALTFLTLISLSLARSSKVFTQLLNTSIITLVLIFSTWYFFAADSTVKPVPKYHLLLIIALPIATLLYGFLNQTKEQIPIPNRFIFLLLVLPYLFAVGSGNNYWLTAAGAGVFWALAAVLILVKSGGTNSQLALIAAFTLAVTSIGLKDALETPYRQSESILLQHGKFIDPHSNEDMLLAQDTANYLNKIKTVITEAKFKAGTPVIDLTGHHPGTLYFMQAKSIGQAWNIGGYRGSEAMASMALYQASCEEIASAWLLMEKDGLRQIPHTMLSRHGIQADKMTYKKMAKFDSQQLFKTQPKKIFEQYLLKPVDIKNQIKACLAYRKLHRSPFE
ncbi:MAG: hypothetical protein E6Q51_01015 [Methylophilus methylotrophus]|uniref:Glycosyltransferase RgtA/B/C/D-like domain-containing protein n=1 Tax=Methylophilus methylotrophus TaxID=17 RepID=A0A5C7WNM9_METME|nr:MAG: hypothetical protein E6Q51_01015 [Methylophilus methylotrophus]